MRKHIRRKQEAHRKALAICDEIRGTIEATGGGKKWLAQLNASVNDVEESFADQQDARNKQRLAKAELDAARTTLRDIMKVIVDVSAVVRLDEGSAKVMVVPQEGSDELLIADANAIYRAASANAKAFEGEGLPAHVIPELGDRIAVFKTAKMANSTARKTFTATAKSSRKGLKAGDEALSVIVAILARSPNIDEKALTKLRSAKRIGPTRPANQPALEPAPALTAPTDPTAPIKVA